ncbi:MAG TPA: hypothetical protein VMM76_15435 [Pirellulaceae bacterium]|nr:hypothetical protein [Pirellulaceae bacterium]
MAQPSAAPQNFPPRNQWRPALLTAAATASAEPTTKPHLLWNDSTASALCML